MSTTAAIIRHIERQNPHYSASTCLFHFEKSCFTLLHNFDLKRYHCLYCNESAQWYSISVSYSCELPEHVHDLFELNRLHGNRYVLRFAGTFRESSGYTVALFEQPPHLYTCKIIKPAALRETALTMLFLLCVTCHRLGGSCPNIKYFSFVYTETHPVLCDIGASNAHRRETLPGRGDHFNKKKWTRFLRRKTILDVLRYLRILFPHFFQKKRGRCILQERGDQAFDVETHRLLCQSGKRSILEVIEDFGGPPMPNAWFER